jgi:hypothetical protein
MFPLFDGTIETEEVFRLFPDGKFRFVVGSVKVDEEDLVFNHQEVFQLKVIVVKTSLMESTKEKPCCLYRFSLMEKVFKGQVRTVFLKILDQVFSVRDF